MRIETKPFPQIVEIVEAAGVRLAGRTRLTTFEGQRERGGKGEERWCRGSDTNHLTEGREEQSNGREKC